MCKAKTKNNEYIPLKTSLRLIVDDYFLRLCPQLRKCLRPTRSFYFSLICYCSLYQIHSFWPLNRRSFNFCSHVNKIKSTTNMFLDCFSIFRSKQKRIRSCRVNHLLCVSIYVWAYIILTMLFSVQPQ